MVKVSGEDASIHLAPRPSCARVHIKPDIPAVATGVGDDPPGATATFGHAVRLRIFELIREGGAVIVTWPAALPRLSSPAAES